jgi:serine/threonine protein kinase
MGNSASSRRAAHPQYAHEGKGGPYAGGIRRHASGNSISSKILPSDAAYVSGPPTSSLWDVLQGLPIDGEVVDSLFGNLRIYSAGGGDFSCVDHERLERWGLRDAALRSRLISRLEQLDLPGQSIVFEHHRHPQQRQGEMRCALGQGGGGVTASVAASDASQSKSRAPGGAVKSARLAMQLRKLRVWPTGSRVDPGGRKQLSHAHTNLKRSPLHGSGADLPSHAPDKSLPGRWGTAGVPEPSNESSSVYRGSDLSLTASSSHLRRGLVRPGMWVLGNRIANGSFGTVYMGLNKSTGELIAIKMVSLPRNDGDVRTLYQEVALMRKFCHPNIVSYMGAEIRESDGSLAIFQEWVPGGSVSSLLRRFGPFSEALTRRYTRQVLAGLEYLHGNDVAHRDIKGSNILVDDKGLVKLADFGASAMLSGGEASNSTLHGTPYFMAPEVLRCEAHGMPVDMWSLAGAILQMLTGRPPWSGSHVATPAALLNVMLQLEGQPPPFDDVKAMSPELDIVMRSCFSWDASKRPTAQELLVHPYFAVDSQIDDRVGIVGAYGTANPERHVGECEVDIHMIKRASMRKRTHSCSSVRAQGPDNTDLRRSDGQLGLPMAMKGAERAPALREAASDAAREEWPSWAKRSAATADLCVSVNVATRGGSQNPFGRAMRSSPAPSPTILKSMRKRMTSHDSELPSTRSCSPTSLKSVSAETIPTIQSVVEATSTPLPTRRKFHLASQIRSQNLPISPTV